MTLPAFYSLDPNEAGSLLGGCLEAEACATEQMLGEARRQGLFSLDMDQAAR